MSTQMTKLLICSVFFVAVVAVTPVTTSTGAETIATTPKKISHSARQLSKKHLDNRNGVINDFGSNETTPPGYLEIGVTLLGVNTGTPIICGVVRLGFGTRTHRGALFDRANPISCRVLTKPLIDDSAGAK